MTDWRKGLVAALWCLLFLFIGGFSIRQSLVLGVSMTFVLFILVFWHESKKPKRLVPHYVQVLPDWYQILKDFRLIDTVEEWRSILESAKQLPFGEHHVLRDGLFFTVLHVSQDFARTLIFWNHNKVFSGEVDYQWSMRPVQLARDDSQRLIQEGLFSAHQDVYLFMRPDGKEGYALGLDVPHSWWNKTKTLCPSPEEEQIDHMTGYVKLVLARISHREWDLYWEPEVWNSDYYFKAYRQIQNRRDGLRLKLGWKTVAHANMPELNIDWPEEMEHKYFRLEHRAV